MPLLCDLRVCRLPDTHKHILERAFMSVVYMHTHMHTHMQTHSLMHTHTRKHARARTHARTHISIKEDRKRGRVYQSMNHLRGRDKV